MDPFEERRYLAALTSLAYNLDHFGVRIGALTRRGALLEERLSAFGRVIPSKWYPQIRDVLNNTTDTEEQRALLDETYVAHVLATGGPSSLISDPVASFPKLLVPVVARISLTGTPGDVAWRYNLPSAGAADVLFPSDAASATLSDYQRLWESQVLGVVEDFPGLIHSYSQMAGLLDLLAAGLTYVPTSLVWDSESLADIPFGAHLQLTAALQVCLCGRTQDELTAWQRLERAAVPVARLVKLDLSGIQSFIYRITEPADQRDFRHTAKRLRGRSFYLTLLNRAIGDWLARHLLLPPTNVLYADGGIVELLVPSDDETSTRLLSGIEELTAGLWDAFHIELGFVWSSVGLEPDDLSDLSAARQELEVGVSRLKDRKWLGLVQQASFFAPQGLAHVCAVCGIRPMQQPGSVCDMCDCHAGLGKDLPYARFLARSEATPPSDVGVTVDLPKPMAGCFTLVRPGKLQALLAWAADQPDEPLLRNLNSLPSPVASWPPNCVPGRWTFANAAPIISGAQDRVYDFEEIANLSQGVPRLGILRGDADRMGLNFSHGLHAPSFSRTMALSQTVSGFFGAYLNQLAAELTEAWREQLDDGARRTLVRRGVDFQNLTSLFYVLYAGGDDLFVIGPWDQMIEFASALSRRFSTYTCGNLTLSAGLAFVKPHFPIQQFARLAAEAEETAKGAGRNRIHLFGKTLLWSQPAGTTPAGFDETITIAKDWAGKIQKREIPRSLIHDLGRMGREQIYMRPYYTPLLYYTLTRRLPHWSEALRRQFVRQVLRVLPHIGVPVSYAGLITRKE